MGEGNIGEFEPALQGEDALRPILDLAAADLRGAGASGLCEAPATLLPPVDRGLLDGEFAEDMAAGSVEGLRDRVDGRVDDDPAFVRPWGFSLDDIAGPAFVRQGSEDLMVPFSHGRWLADRVPGAVAHLERGEGHLSIAVGAADRMLRQLSDTL